MEQSIENINNSRQVAEVSNTVAQNQKKLVSPACNCIYYYHHKILNCITFCGYGTTGESKECTGSNSPCKACNSRNQKTRQCAG